MGCSAVLPGAFVGQVVMFAEHTSGRLYFKVCLAQHMHPMQATQPAK